MACGWENAVGPGYDLDLLVFATDEDGKLHSQKDFVYYSNRHNTTNTIRLLQDIKVPPTPTVLGNTRTLPGTTTPAMLATTPGRPP